MMVIVLLFAQQSAFTRMCPDGTYVAGNNCTMAPDGSYVGGSRSTMAPDGSYTVGSHRQINTDSKKLQNGAAQLFASDYLRR